MLYTYNQTFSAYKNIVGRIFFQPKVPLSLSGVPSNTLNKHIDLSL